MGINDVRKLALMLPETEESMHFNLPSFKVLGKAFVVLQRDTTHALLSVSPTQAEALVREDPAVFEEVWRQNGRIFVGVRVPLKEISRQRLRQSIELAWRNKAPKRLVSAFVARK